MGSGTDSTKIKPTVATLSLAEPQDSLYLMKSNMFCFYDKLVFQEEILSFVAISYFVEIPRFKIVEEHFNVFNPRTADWKTNQNCPCLRWLPELYDHKVCQDSSPRYKYVLLFSKTRIAATKIVTSEHELMQTF